MHRTTRAVVFGILAVTISTATATAEDARWVQYVPGGLEARAITDKAQCPPAAIDNVSMHAVRAGRGFSHSGLFAAHHAGRESGNSRRRSGPAAGRATDTHSFDW